ncbi:zinc ABC transporter ATP-binding protein [Fibrobacterales bacterium]|nr:zinc ABC transporter ATP-binding protein [Fibrobacterales bacterium]
MPLVSCNSVSFSYNGKNILNNLSFEVKRSDFCGIIGKNGSGKSTLLQGILGLKKVSDGKIEVDSDAKKHGFGYLAQNYPHRKYFPATVLEVVMSGLLSKKGVFSFFNSKDKNYALEKMSSLGIEHLQNRKFGELSGGEAQKTLLVRALCVSEKYLFLDEPSSGLDEKSQEELNNIIAGLHKNGATIIMVSHNIEYIKTNANNIVKLK